MKRSFRSWAKIETCVSRVHTQSNMPTTRNLSFSHSRTPSLMQAHSLHTHAPTHTCVCTHTFSSFSFIQQTYSFVLPKPSFWTGLFKLCPCLFVIMHAHLHSLTNIFTFPYTGYANAALFPCSLLVHTPTLFLFLSISFSLSLSHHSLTTTSYLPNTKLGTFILAPWEQ